MNLKSDFKKIFRWWKFENLYENEPININTVCLDTVSGLSTNYTDKNIRQMLKHINICQKGGNSNMEILTNAFNSIKDINRQNELQKLEITELNNERSEVNIAINDISGAIQAAYNIILSEDSSE